MLVGGRRRKRRFRKSVWTGPHGDCGDEGEECADRGAERQRGDRGSLQGARVDMGSEKRAAGVQTRKAQPVVIAVRTAEGLDAGG